MASTVLTRTPASTGNRKTFTLSFWVKRTSIASGNKCPFAIGNSASSLNDADWFTLMFHGSTNTLRLVQYNNILFTTNRVFRDTSSWYHIVVAVDTTQATSSDRIKLYINGVQETSFSTVNYPSQNYDFAVNNTVTHSIGREDENGSVYFDGLLSHYHFIDGTQYQASDFGEYDANGVWKIKTSPSVTYGTNGFFILKDGNSVTDQSGNGNNFTVAGGTLTNTEDSPSNVFATGNPIDNGSDKNPVYLNGNNSYSVGSAVWRFAVSTLGMTSGKFYMEQKCGTALSFIGVTDQYPLTANSYANSNSFVGSVTESVGYYSDNGNKYINNVQTSYGDSYTANDIVGCALDIDNGYVYFSKNGTWQNSGDPTSGATGTGGIALPSGGNVTGTWFFMPSLYNGTLDVNYGNGYFGTTAVASAGTNASGNGIFEYDVPTGYTALSTKGLNE